MYFEVILGEGLLFCLTRMNYLAGLIINLLYILFNQAMIKVKILVEYLNRLIVWLAKRIN